MKFSDYSLTFLSKDSAENLTSVIRIINRAWQHGDVSIEEFSTFINLIKSPHYLQIMPNILGCYRLHKKMQIMLSDCFTQVVELYMIVINQATNNYDISIPSKLTIQAQTYHKLNPDGSKEYLFDRLKRANIFKMSQYWEAYLLQQIGQGVSQLQLETGNTVEAASRRQNMQESIVMIFMTIILEMIQTKFEAKVAK